MLHYATDFENIKFPRGNQYHSLCNKGFVSFFLFHRAETGSRESKKKATPSFSFLFALFPVSARSNSENLTKPQGNVCYSLRASSLGGGGREEVLFPPPAPHPQESLLAGYVCYAGYQHHPMRAETETLLLWLLLSTKNFLPNENCLFESSAHQLELTDEKLQKNNNFNRKKKSKKKWREK